MTLQWGLEVTGSIVAVSVPVEAMPPPSCFKTPSTKPKNAQNAQNADRVFGLLSGLGEEP